MSTAVEGTLLCRAGHEGQPETYGDQVRDAAGVDLDEWANLLAELLDGADLSPEQAAHPNGPVPANWRTIRKWLKRQQGVGADSVIAVSRAFGYPVVHALVRVRLLTQEEAGLAPLARTDPLVRRISRALTDPNFSEQARKTLRTAVESAYNVWLEMMRLRAPREPSAAERAAGGRRGRAGQT